MEEVIMENNKTDLRVFINGKPNLIFISENELKIVCTTLELQITEYYGTKYNYENDS